MAIEQLKYTVVTSYGGFEIRQYAAHIVAQTRVDGHFEWVGNVAFRRLAGYIFGKNRRRNSIAMTAPVIQTPNSQKIAMTAPVKQQKSNNNAWIVSFVMPSAYTLDTLAKPLDSSVELVERPGELMAALTYSGDWRKSRFEKKKRHLIALLQRHGYAAVGDIVFARYNPPYTIWFMRRNEVLIPVQKIAEVEPRSDIHLGE